MGRLIHSMTVSLDGFVTGPDGGIDWSVPSEELHQFHNDQVRELGAHFLGRRLYETMLFWEDLDEEASGEPVMREFADIWQALPRVVFSTTLQRVEGNARLARAGIAAEVAALRDQTDKDIGVGGASLAAAFAELGLIDEYRLFVAPVVLGGGTPYFQAVTSRIDLELLETRTFGGQTIYLRYVRTR